MEREYWNHLYDLYKNLLTHHEQEVFEYYYQEDLSLSEIGEFSNVSRTAVHNTVKVVEEKLKEYEELLHLEKKEKELKEVLEYQEIDKIKKRIEEILAK